MLNNILSRILAEQLVLSTEDREYLKKRIRPAMQSLIELEDLAAMKKITDLISYGESDMSAFIQYASNKDRKLALLWLLQEKKKRFGFKDRSFYL